MSIAIAGEAVGTGELRPQSELADVQGVESDPGFPKRLEHFVGCMVCRHPSALCPTMHAMLCEACAEERAGSKAPCIERRQRERRVEELFGASV